MLLFVVIPFLAALSSASTQAPVSGELWFRAASEGDTAMLKGLLAENVPVDQRGPGSQTALMLAAFGGHSEAVMLLLSVGADIEARDEDGGTALMNAAATGHAPVVQILLDARADPNVSAPGGVGPLLVAAVAVGGPHREVLIELLEAGADLGGLLRYLQHPEPSARARIVMALAVLGTHAKTAVPELAEALKDQNLNVRYWAASALGGIGPDASAAVPRLIEALETYPHRSPPLEGPLRYYADVRMVAARALGAIGSPAAVPALRETLADENPDVRDAASKALDKLAASSSRNDDSR